METIPLCRVTLEPRMCTCHCANEPVRTPHSFRAGFDNSWYRSERRSVAVAANDDGPSTDQRRISGVEVPAGFRNRVGLSF